MRVFAFVPVERSLRPRVGLFAPLRDKVTSSAQSLVLFGSAPPRDRGLSILTEPHDELVPLHPITSSPLFAERVLRNIGSGLSRQFDLMLAPRITFPHLSVSSAMSLAKSAGEPASVVAPRSTNRALIFRSTRAALISLLSTSTISGGVFLGAPMPTQVLVL